MEPESYLPESEGAVPQLANDTAAANIVTRQDFSRDFVFGTASSAYQIEGGAKEDGRGPSVWDTFLQRNPGKVKDGSNGNAAIDSYHLYKVRGNWNDMNIYYCNPGGRLSGGVNKAGIQYYNNLIDELLANGIEPYVTLFHWDLPQALEDEYRGFLSPRVVPDFCEYAELCFWEFGDRVKNWITLNEPYTYSVGGYVFGTTPPGRGASTSEHIAGTYTSSKCVHNKIDENCDGDAGTEPYLATHYQLLAHAAAVELYRRKFQTPQGGKIGITLVSKWFEPLDENSDLDVQASLRALDWFFGWFMEPITRGDYPQSMKQYVGSRLPKFTKVQSQMLKGSFDFLGLNYYTANYASHGIESNNGLLSYNTDPQVTYATARNGVPIGPPSASDWLFIYPEGIYKLLGHVKNVYNDPLIYITENGVDEVNDGKLTLSEARIDTTRLKYHQDHLFYLKKAIDDGANVKGYFIWSLLDNFEWNDGYSVRFGIIHVDYKNEFARYPKATAIWFMNFLAKGFSKVSAKRGVSGGNGFDSTKKLKK
ncbi:hypothetical protein RJ639_031660 [Escallonia herrerae]|uniref:Beta-glucosidase n=1 Tax=Escallonia herrerae TaxID=1293975 RepID=A0AA88X1C1_9ASTE|nr:hypothetical protein RJ639_031660 [Escallonia herrerae]